MGNNRDFIKGGLPLGSKDFVNQDNIREKKSRLLAALDNINKVHDTKMSEIVDTSYASNNQAIDSTLDYMEQGVSYAPADANGYVDENSLDASVDASLFDAPTVQNEEYAYNNDVSLDNTVQFDNNGEFQPFDSVQDSNPEEYQVDESVFEPNNEISEDVQEEYPQPEYQDQGDPEFVLDESQVGKRAKGKKKSAVASGDVKRGRLIAWLAYTIFFIPLLFAGKNSFVRHHANEGLCINILDLIGIGLYFASEKLVLDGAMANYVLPICGLVGIVVLCLTLFSRIILIFLSLLGKEGEAPLFGKLKIIK